MIKSLKLLAAAVSLIAAVSLSSFAGTDSADEDITVQVNGKTIECEQPAVIYNDRTFIPMRDIFGAIDVPVGWNDTERKAVAAKGSDIVEIPVDSNVIYKNGTPIEIDAPAMIVNGRMMIPLRAAAEALGCSVEWNDGTVSVTADISHNPVLVDFAENKFENTEVQIRDNNGGPVSDNPSYFTAHNKINSYCFIDIDYDGEEELIISSEPDVKAENLDWWGGVAVGCLSIWDCGNDGEVINIFAKESVPHRLVYKPHIVVSDGRLCLMESYLYSSSGNLFSERRTFNITDGKPEKAKEIVFRELFDCKREDEYQEIIAEYEMKPSFIEHFEENGEKYVKMVYGDVTYIIDGAAANREEAFRVLSEFDDDCTVIFDCFDRWRE